MAEGKVKTILSRECLLDFHDVYISASFQLELLATKN